MMMFNVLNAATWGDMAKKKEKGFFDFEFITGIWQLHLKFGTWQLALGNEQWALGIGARRRMLGYGRKWYRGAPRHKTGPMLCDSGPACARWRP